MDYPFIAITPRSTLTHNGIAQSAGTVDYTDSISVEG